MLIVGLTGGIGAGKTTVTALFAARGAPIIDADVIAHELTQPNNPAYANIIAHFGKEMQAEDGTLQRKKLRDHIFQHPAERKWLENLLHPLINARIQQQLSLINAPYCLISIPLLFETKSYPYLNRILVIDARESTQIARVSLRDQSDPAQVAAILKAQATREERLGAADDVIVNDGSLAELEAQVDLLHRRYSA